MAAQYHHRATPTSVWEVSTRRSPGLHMQWGCRADRYFVAAAFESFGPKGPNPDERLQRKRKGRGASPLPATHPPYAGPTPHPGFPNGVSSDSCTPFPNPDPGRTRFPDIDNRTGPAGPGPGPQLTTPSPATTPRGLRRPSVTTTTPTTWTPSSICSWKGWMARYWDTTTLRSESAPRRDVSRRVLPGHLGGHLGDPRRRELRHWRD